MAKLNGKFEDNGWYPCVNCGYRAGEYPECWGGEIYDSEEECNAWINEHQDEFTEDELAGCVYARKVD